MIAVLYLATELWQLVTRPTVMVGVRILIYAFVFRAALRGSPWAAGLWGIASAVATAACGYALWIIARHGAVGVSASKLAYLSLMTAFFAAGTLYIVRSQNLKAFQRSRRIDGPPDGARVTLRHGHLTLIRYRRPEVRVALDAIERIAVRSHTKVDNLPHVWIELWTDSGRDVPSAEVGTLADDFTRFEAWLLALPDFDAAGYRQLLDCGENARRVVWQRAT